jgi:hypothetical protein
MGKRMVAFKANERKTTPLACFFRAELDFMCHDGLNCNDDMKYVSLNEILASAALLEACLQVISPGQGEGCRHCPEGHPPSVPRSAASWHYLTTTFCSIPIPLGNHRTLPKSVLDPQTVCRIPPLLRDFAQFRIPSLGSDRN